MLRKTFAFLSVVMAVVHCQSYPRFELGGRFESKGEIFFNNSYISHRQIGTGNDVLKCVTNNTDCCTCPDVGNWIDGSGGTVHQGASGANAIHVTRRNGTVSLNLKSVGGSSGFSGMWRCDIPDSSGVMQSIYIYLDVENKGTVVV